MKKNQGSNSQNLFRFDANCIYTHPRSSTGPKQLKHGENYTETCQNQIAQNRRKREILKSKRKEIYDVQRNKMRMIIDYSLETMSEDNGTAPLK